MWAATHMGHAWLQLGDTNVQCVVQVKHWTADAVGVQVTIDGETLRCWIWPGAYQRISDPTESGSPAANVSRIETGYGWSGFRSRFLVGLIFGSSGCEA